MDIPSQTPSPVEIPLASNSFASITSLLSATKNSNRYRQLRVHFLTVELLQCLPYYPRGAARVAYHLHPEAPDRQQWVRRFVACNDPRPRRYWLGGNFSFPR
jgi:hypothetical protein